MIIYFEHPQKNRLAIGHGKCIRLRQQLEAASIPYKVVTQAEHDAQASDRTFRGAWHWDNTPSPSNIIIDINQAIELAKERIRIEREPLIMKLDIDYTIADEAGDQAEKDRIAAKKQALRDATIDPRILNSTDEVELKQAMEDVIREL